MFNFTFFKKDNQTSDKNKTYDPAKLYLLDYGIVVRMLIAKDTYYEKKRRVLAIELTPEEREEFIEQNYRQTPRFMNTWYDISGDPNTRFFKLITHGNVILPCLSGLQKYLVELGAHEIVSNPLKLSMLYPCSVEKKYITLEEICEKENQLNGFKPQNNEQQMGEE